ERMGGHGQRDRAGELHLRRFGRGTLRRGTPADPRPDKDHQATGQNGSKHGMSFDDCGAMLKRREYVHLGRLFLLSIVTSGPPIVKGEFAMVSTETMANFL